jgi:hypothetical protein
MSICSPTWKNLPSGLTGVPRAAVALSFEGFSTKQVATGPVTAAEVTPGYYTNATKELPLKVFAVAVKMPFPGY